MSEGNVGLVACIYDETRDYTAFYDPERTEAVFASFSQLYHPTFEFQVVVEGDLLVRHGIHGYLALMREWLAPWGATTSRPMSSGTSVVGSPSSPATKAA